MFTHPYGEDPDHDGLKKNGEGGESCLPSRVRWPRFAIGVLRRRLLCLLDSCRKYSPASDCRAPSLDAVGTADDLCCSLTSDCSRPNLQKSTQDGVDESEMCYTPMLEALAEKDPHHANFRVSTFSSSWIGRLAP